MRGREVTSDSKFNANHIYTCTCTLTTHTLPHSHYQCPRHEHLSFVGELLLGLKFTEEDSPPEDDEVDKHNGDVPVIREKRGGQLQVHVVEGAGIFDEETRKPFNAVVKW